MDPLSDVLSLLKPRNYMSAGFDAAGDWSIQFPDQGDSLKCGAIVSGHCWLSVDDVPDAVRLETGDCFLLPSGRPFRLSSDPSLPSIGAREVFAQAQDGGIVTWQGGGDLMCVSSRFVLDGAHANILLRMLPPVVYIRKAADRDTLRWSIERMMQELHDPQPGAFLIIQYLAHMVLVQALRLHLTSGLKENVGWLFALADKQMGAAISAMHAAPGQRWTLQNLAAEAGMSRSVFAQKFKTMVGSSPLDYLTRWRMLLACERLAHTTDAISTISLSLGYESESAFSTAFKRTKGCSPRQYSRGQNI